MHGGTHRTLWLLGRREVLWFFPESPVSVASAACREYTARVVETLRTHRFVERKNLENRHRASDLEECVASFFCDSDFYKVAP